MLAFCALAIGGCGEEDEPGAKSPRLAFELFVTGVLEDEAVAVDLVSRDLDEEERESFVRAARSDVEPLGRGYRIVFDRRVSDRVAIVAAQGESHPHPGAHAFVVVRDGETWFVEPNRADLVYGVSAVRGTTARRPVVDFQLNMSGEHRRPRGRLWLDDREVRLREGPDAQLHTFRADVRLLERRMYSAVAYAEVGGRRGAIAWTFRVR